MPEEFTDGQLHGHLAVEWHEDRPVRVPIVNFNFDSLDRIEADAKEAIEAGRFPEWLARYVAAQVQEARCEAVHAVVSEVIDAKNPYQALIFIASASGIAVVLEKTEEQWGAILGVSKQNVQQGIDAVTTKLRLRKNRAMRNQEAKDQMKIANFRPKEKVPS